MKTWRLETKRGLRELARHQPHAAMVHLGRAVRDCPEAYGADLARALFYLGVALRRLGMANAALRSWMSGQRLVKRGLGSRMVSRFANGYGMERQATREQDDWEAFRSVQIGRYLRVRAGQSFQSSVERELITGLILQHWEELRSERDLGSMTVAEKSALFRAVRVPVPAFVGAKGCPTIAVDFMASRGEPGRSRCPCGSGRPFSACCGRVSGLDELVSGT